MPLSRSRALVALLAAAIAVGALLAASGKHADARAGAGDRPNVLIVMTDDQTVRDMRALDQVKRRIGRRGVTFENAFATFPLCCPSRASILTGQYAHNHGVTANNAKDGGGFANFDDRGSMPIALKRNGYRTAMIGKYLNGYGGRTVPRGWSHWAAKSKGGRMYDYKLNIDGRIRSFGSGRREYQTDVLTRLSKRFLRRASRGRKPFFLLTSYSAPHTERRPGWEGPNPRPAPRHEGRFRHANLPKPPSFDEKDVSDKPLFIRRVDRLDRADRRKLRNLYRSRLAALLAVDDGVKELLRVLRRKDELDDTYVIFLSDNGYLFGEHRKTRKTLLYEEAARIPLLMRGPQVPRGAVRSQLVGNIDIAPTLYQLTGTAPRRTPDGLSLFEFAVDPAFGANRDLLLENRESVAVREPGWVYMEHQGGARELYDLSEDPFQLDSLHASPAASGKLAQLDARLEELRDCAGPACG